MRFFNTAGPVNPALHYCLDPLRRLELDALLPLIEQQKYFVLHAPRQTGKTTCLLALREYLNAGDRYRCVYVNVEIAQSAREDVAAAMRAILAALGDWARDGAEDRYPGTIRPAILERHGSSLDRVVKCTVFLAEINEWPAFNEVYREYFQTNLPARSALAASGLALGARVEVECIAFVPSNK